MREYRILQDAADELTDSVEFYENSSTGLGGEFLTEFDLAMSLICEMNEAWSKVDDYFRRYHMRRFPFVILYRSEEGIIIVTSVFHTSRKPNQWKRNR